MSLNEALKAKIIAAIKSGVVSGEESLLKKYPWLVTVTSDGYAYANPRVTAGIDSLSAAEVTCVRCIPLPKEGFVVVVSAQPGEPGAVAFLRDESRRTGTFSIRAALVEFHVKLSKDRKLKFPVIVDQVPTSQGLRPFVALRVKRPAALKTATRAVRG